MKDAGELQKEVPHEALVNTKLPKALLRNRGEVYEFLQIRNVSHCFLQKRMPNLFSKI